MKAKHTPEHSKIIRIPPCPRIYKKMGIVTVIEGGRKNYFGKCNEHVCAYLLLVMEIGENQSGALHLPY